MTDPRNELGDPSTSPQRLFEIAQSNPELGSLIAAHPNAYPDLKQWVAQLAPAAPAAIPAEVADPAFAAQPTPAAEAAPVTTPEAAPAAQPEAFAPQAPVAPASQAEPVAPAAPAFAAPAAPVAPEFPAAPAAPAAFPAQPPAAPTAPQAYGAPAASAAPFTPPAYGAPAAPAAPVAPQAYGAPAAAAPVTPPAYGAVPPTATQAYPTADQSQFTQPTMPLPGAMGAAPGAGYPGGPVPPAAAASGGMPPKKSRKGLWITIVSVVLVVALAVTGGLIWWNISSKVSGAKTPDEAASKVLNSFTSLDQLSIYGSLAPSEIAPFQESFDKWMSELDLEDDSDTSKKLEDLFNALDVKVENLETEATELIPGVERVAYVSGTITVDGDEDKIVDAVMALYEESGSDMGSSLDYMADSLRDELDLPYVLDFADVERELGMQPSIVVVQEGDLWYMSPMLTIADTAYLAMEQYGSMGKLGTSVIEGRPSDTPEAAGTDLFDAIANGSLEDIAAQLPLAERRLLSIYGPAFQIPKGWNDEIDMDNADFSAEVDGDTARLNMVDVEFSVSFYDYWAERDLKGSINFFDHCAVVTSERYNYYSEKITTDSMEGCLDEAIPFYFELGLDNMAIIAVKEDGGWYVSPVRTIADLGAIVGAHTAKLAEEGRLEEVLGQVPGL